MLSIKAVGLHTGEKCYSHEIEVEELYSKGRREDNGGISGLEIMSGGTHLRTGGSDLFKFKACGSEGNLGQSKAENKN